MLLCVGNFFGINNTEFSAYKTGRKKGLSMFHLIHCIYNNKFTVPIPTYILGPNKDEHIQYYPKGEIEFEICENLYYLGKLFYFVLNDVCFNFNVQISIKEIIILQHAFIK